MRDLDRGDVIRPGLQKQVERGEAVEIASNDLLLGNQESPHCSLVTHCSPRLAAHPLLLSSFQVAFQKFSGISHSNPTFPSITSTSIAKRPPLSSQAVGNTQGKEL